MLIIFLLKFISISFLIKFLFVIGYSLIAFFVSAVCDRARSAATVFLATIAKIIEPLIVYYYEVGIEKNAYDM